MRWRVWNRSWFFRQCFHHRAPWVDCLLLEMPVTNKSGACYAKNKQPDKTKNPIQYWSRSVSSAERVYDTTDQVCLAILWAVLLLWPYEEGTRLTIRTDYDCLKWILNLSNAAGGLVCWGLQLSELDFHVVHRASGKHKQPRHCDGYVQMERRRSTLTMTSLHATLRAQRRSGNDILYAYMYLMRRETDFNHSSNQKKTAPKWKRRMYARLSRLIRT